MFKYISEILKQFTQAQKLTVLITLLMTIIGITYINSITKTPAELTKTVELQRKAILKDQNYIYGLSQIINSLNDTILSKNEECNDRAMKREMVYNQKMIEQQKYVSNAIEEIKKMMSSNNKLKNSSIFKMEMASADSSFTKSEIMSVRIPVPAPNIDNKIIEKLNKIKKVLKDK